MAKRKQEDPPKGSPAWMATFSDLMNLLLCFFVLLFSMSSVDAAKFNEVVASFSSNFSIFKAGSTAIGEGTLISTGASQLNQLDEYFSNAGKASETDEVDQADPLEQYKEQMKEEAKEKTEELYEELIEKTEQSNLQDYLDIKMDEDGYQFVQISLSGAILFDSGQADIKPSAEGVMNKVGDILTQYKNHTINIIGHTDSINISNARFKDNMELSQERALSVFRYLRDVKKMNPRTLESSGRGEYEPIGDNRTPEGRSKNRRVEIKIYSQVEK